MKHFSVLIDKTISKNHGTADFFVLHEKQQKEETSQNKQNDKQDVLLTYCSSIFL